MDATHGEMPLVACAAAATPARQVVQLVPPVVRPAWRATVVGRVVEAAPWCVAAGVVGVIAGGDRWSKAAAAGVGVLLAAAAVVDVREFRLPNRLTGAAFVVALGGAATGGDAAVLAAALGAVVAGSLLFVVHLSRGVGMGDVKAAAAIGMSLGPAAWWASPLAVAVAALSASVVGMVRRVHRLPFGPALVLGWATVALATRWW